MVGDIVDAELLADITGDVFAGMFGEERERPVVTDTTSAGYDVRSTVDISGGWEGTVVFSCELALVQLAAAELFGAPPGDVAAGDLADLAGEVVNVVGGNIKSLLPGPSALSLPRTALDAPVAALSAAVSVDMVWCGRALRVDVVAGGVDRA